MHHIIEVNSHFIMTFNKLAKIMLFYAHLLKRYLEYSDFNTYLINVLISSFIFLFFISFFLHTIKIQINFMESRSKKFKPDIPGTSTNNSISFFSKFN